MAGPQTAGRLPQPALHRAGLRAHGASAQRARVWHGCDLVYRAKVLPLTLCQESRLLSQKGCFPLGRSIFPPTIWRVRAITQERQARTQGWVCTPGACTHPEGRCGLWDTDRRSAALGARRERLRCRRRRSGRQRPPGS